MDTTGKKLFKTSVVGGFNRDDVFAYIENLVNTHNAEVAKLREELKASAAQVIALKGEKEELSQKLGAAVEKEKTLAAELAEKSAAADRAAELEEENRRISAELDAKNSECAADSAELAQLREKVAQYAAMEEEYASNKSRIAEIELCALARASELEQAAEAKASDICERAQAQYRDCCDKIEEGRRAAQSEMNKIMADVKAVYSRMCSELCGFNTRFEDLLSNTRANIRMLTDSTAGISANFAALEEKCGRFYPAEAEGDSEE